MIVDLFCFFNVLLLFGLRKPRKHFTMQFQIYSNHVISLIIHDYTCDSQEPCTHILIFCINA